MRIGPVGLQPAGWSPVVVGVMGRGVKDSPSCFLPLPFNTSPAPRRFGSDRRDVLDARLDRRGMMHRRTLAFPPFRVPSIWR